MSAVSLGHYARFARQHGLRAAGFRAASRLYRLVVRNRVVLFSADLSRSEGVSALPAGMRVARVSAESELRPADRNALLSYWDPAIKQRQIRRRFAQGATLWLVQDAERLAGFGWSSRGPCPSSAFVALGPDDVRCFDFEVFPGWRGRGINPALIAHVLRTSAQEGARRAFLEVYEWNTPSLRSVAKLPFRPVGTARLIMIGDKNVVWSRRGAASHSTRARV